MRVDDEDELAAALHRLGLTGSCPVVVVVGDAGGMSGAAAERAAPVLGDAVVPVCEELSAAIVDGGTDSGVMRLTGEAHAARHATFPLIGVVAAGTAQTHEGSAPDAAPLEPNHTHFVVVPGSSWGDESPWLTRVAVALAAGAPIAGVLIGGGPISAHDVEHLGVANIPVFAISGTGRLADEITSVGESDHVQLVRAIEDPERLAVALRGVLEGA